MIQSKLNFRNLPLRFVLIGVSGAVPAEVTAVYTRALNKPAHLSDLLAIAANMQSAYRALGFILVRVVVPPQEIDLKQGEVTFQQYL